MTCRIYRLATIPSYPIDSRRRGQFTTFRLPGLHRGLPTFSRERLNLGMALYWCLLPLPDIPAKSAERFNAVHTSMPTVHKHVHEYRPAKWGITSLKLGMSQLPMPGVRAAYKPLPGGRHVV